MMSPCVGKSICTCTQVCLQMGCGFLCFVFMFLNIKAVGVQRVVGVYVLPL